MDEIQNGSGDKDTQKEQDKKIDWKQKIIQYTLPVLAKSRAAIEAEDPRSVLAGHPHEWHALFLTLCIVGVGTIAAYCSGHFLPYRFPFDMLGSSLVGFLVPTLDYIVIGQLLIFPVLLGVASFFICMLCGIEAARHLPASERKVEQNFVRDLCAACSLLTSTYVFVGAIFIACVFWGIDYVLEAYWKDAWLLTLNISYEQLTFGATILLMMIVPFKIRPIIHRAKIKMARPLAFGLVISFFVGYGSMMFSVATFARTESAYFKRSEVTSKMHDMPVAGVIEVCEHQFAKINCTITLYPEHQQNFEYIGNWGLSGSLKPGMPSVTMNGVWRPVLQASRNVPTVDVNEKRDISVDISADSSDICRNFVGAGGGDSFFFFTKGRIKGEQWTKAKDLQIHIVNDQPKFDQLMAAACRPEHV